MLINMAGEIIAYDIDRENITPFRIPYCWREQNPRGRASPIVSLQFHPKDIGSLLIGYAEGPVIFSFKQNKPIKFFHYEVPRGAPGGDADPTFAHQARHPRLTQAIWHPTGTFVLTAHEDSSLVFWDPRDVRIVEARTLQNISVHTPGGGQQIQGGAPATVAVKEPYFKLAWCSKQNPDDTGLLISGGSPSTNPTRGLTFFDFGPTPTYQTSSWEILSKHFQQPKSTNILATPPGAEVVNFLLIPRSSPHYAGSQDPIAVIAILSSGELVTMSFPTGHPISPTNMLPLSLSFIHPFVTKISLACVDRTKWLGMVESRQRGPEFVIGGAAETKAMKRFENRNIVQTAHADGVVRLWDAGHGDQIENTTVIQADLAQAVGRWEDLQVTAMSFSGAAAELSIGLATGELVVFRVNRNPNAGRLPQTPGPNQGPGHLTNIINRADPAVKSGMLPLTLLDEQSGPVTALKHSDVGFVVAGFRSGSIAIVDLRGPVIIHNGNIKDTIHRSRKGSIRKSVGQHEHHHHQQSDEWPCMAEFGVMTLDGEGKIEVSGREGYLLTSIL